MTEDPGGKGWGRYYEATAERPPRPTLVAALERLGPGNGRSAVDLGCGDGRDTVAMLRAGWSVLAIDAEPEALARLQARPDLPPAGELAGRVARFEATQWPDTLLLNASFCLPLCPPTEFPSLWRRLRASLLPGGCFAGQLYGPRDDWAGQAGMTHHDKPALTALLQGLEILRLDEEESDAVTPRGRAKHWHIFHILARRS